MSNIILASPHGGGGVAQDRDIVNENLLINPYLDGNHRINQKGNSTSGDQTDWAYFLDGWKGFGHNIQFLLDGIQLSIRSNSTYASIIQMIPISDWYELCKPQTLSVLINNELYKQSIDNAIDPWGMLYGQQSRIDVVPNENTKFIILQVFHHETYPLKFNAFKLEEGYESTLARKNGDINSIYNVDKDAELRKCRKYYFRTDNNPYISGAFFRQNLAVVNIPTNIDMFRIPTVNRLSDVESIIDASGCRIYNTDGNWDYTVINAGPTGLKLKIDTKDDTFAVGPMVLADLDFEFDAQIY